MRADGSVKPRAFLPSRSHGDNTSVFAVGELTSADVCDISRVELEPRYGRPAQGFARFEPADVLHAGLVVDKDEPPLRHRVIVGWPAAPEDRTEKALVLAAKSIFCSCAAP